MKIKPALSFAAALALFALTWAGSANAAVTVASTADSGPGSLRQAIKDAPSGETINVPAGTYTLTGGPLTINKTLTLAGAGSGATTITSAGNFRMIQSSEGNLTLSGLSLRGAHVEGNGGSGGAIYSQSAKLVLQGVAVTENTLADDGAKGESGGDVSGSGIYQDGDLALVDSQVTGNRALARGGSGGHGGDATGAIYLTGSLEAVRANISGNLTDVSGGQGPSDPGQYGGEGAGSGLYVSASEPGASRIVDSTISGNLLDVSNGPGASLGGIGSGAGVYLVSSAAPVAIENTTIAGNTLKALGPNGDAGGGGAYLNGERFSFRNVTIAANRIEGEPSLGSGGNIYLFADESTFQSSIVSAGTGPESDSTNCSAPVAPKSLGFNIDSTEQCDFGTSTDLNNADPQLGPLQDNGGPGPTMLPAASSPAVDRGAPGLIGDERSVPRPIDFPTIPNGIGSDGSDIGAVELQPASGLTLGKLTRNKKKGTATLVVSLPQPSVGSLGLTGKGLKPQALAITGQDRAVLKILPVGKVKKALKKKGKRKVGISVSYAPTANAIATATLKPKLLRKKHKHHRKGHQKRHGHAKR